MKTILKRVALSMSVALLAAGCGKDDGPGQIASPCPGSNPVTGVYVSSSPVMSMDVAQCGDEVAGTLTYGGQVYQLTGVVESGEFSFTTKPIDLCAAAVGAHRSVSSHSKIPLSVNKLGGELLGSIQINDAYCASSRARVQSWGGVTFVRQ